MDCSTPGLPIHHQLPEFTKAHVHWVSDAIQPSHPLSSPSLPIFNLSQHQGLFTPWQIDGETMEMVKDFIFLCSKITTDGDCSHEIKRRLLLGRKAMTNLDSILKSKDITLPTKVHLVKALVFPIVLYGCESGTIRKAGRQRIDAFELWCWRTLLRVPWTARRSNQSILKKISPKYSLEGLILKLKLQYFGHLIWSTDSFEKTLMLRKTEGRRNRGDRGWDVWIASLTQQTWVWVNSGSWWIGRLGMQPLGSQRVGHDWATELNCAYGDSLCYCLTLSGHSIFSNSLKVKYEELNPITS